MTPRQTPDAVRDEVAREILSKSMRSKHWADMVLKGLDDEWGVIKPSEAISAILAALDSRAGDAGEDGGKALFEHEMRQRGVQGLWADLDEDEREGWRESARVVLSATPAPAVNANKDTVAFVQEWLMSGDYPADTWTREFAAAIDALSKPAVDALGGRRIAPSAAGNDGEITYADRDLFALICPDLASLIWGGDFDDHKEMQAIVRHRTGVIPHANSIDGADIWEALFSIMKGNVPDGMTEDVCGQLAVYFPHIFALPSHDALMALENAMRGKTMSWDFHEGYQQAINDMRKAVQP